MEKGRFFQKVSENNKLKYIIIKRMLGREAIGSSDNTENNYDRHRTSNIIVEIDVNIHGIY